tara:strand:+ start:1044 stop:1334 length:291 start_codon:yes stop_codon:yes gene_type:complete
MKILNSDEQVRTLRTKAQELSSRITNGDNESMYMMDEWYDTIRLLEHLGDHKGLVALSGGDLPLIEDYINEDCVLLVTDKAYKAASRAMGPGPEEM